MRGYKELQAPIQKGKKIMKEVTKMTKKCAKEAIEANKDMTAFFDESMTQNDMYKMLRYRMRFGEAETRVIMSALILSGAKFKDEAK